MLAQLLISSQPQSSLQSAWQLAEQLTGLKWSETSPDATVITGQPSSIKIDQIRQLVHWLVRKPVQHDHKLAIIHQAQQLTLAAQQALLKTLEEPPANCLLILTAPPNHQLLPTLTSRLMIVPQTSTDLPEIDPLIPRFASQPVAQRWQSWSEIQAQLEDFLTQLQHWLHQRLLAQPDSAAVLQAVQVQLTAQSYLKAQVNPQLLADYLILHLPVLARPPGQSGG